MIAKLTRNLFAGTLVTSHIVVVVLSMYLSAYYNDPSWFALLIFFIPLLLIDGVIASLPWVEE